MCPRKSRKPHPGKNVAVEASAAKQGLLTLLDVAKLCHVSKATVSLWGRTDKVKVVKVGRRVFVDRPSLLKYLGPEGVKLLGIPAPEGTNAA